MSFNLHIFWLLAELSTDKITYTKSNTIADNVN